MDDRASRLREARTAAGFSSASAAAAKHGWTTSTYIAHENGQNHFDADRAAVYAGAFGVDAAWLLLVETRQEPDVRVLSRMTLGDLIREERHRRNWSLADLGERLNVTRAAVGQWENNVSRPGIDNMLALSKLLDIPSDRMLSAGASDGGDERADGKQTVQVDPVLAAVWQKMTAAQRRKLLQIALIVAED
jgi:transcriptional regulator with XRE-family HTH domain